MKGPVFRGTQGTPGQEPGLSQGRTQIRWAPSGVVPAPAEGTSFPVQEAGKLRALAWPLGTPRGAPVPSLSCLVPCPADVQPLLADLAQPCSLTHCFPWGLWSQAGRVGCARLAWSGRQASVGLGS